MKIKQQMVSFKETQGAFIILALRSIHTLEFMTRVWLEQSASITSPRLYRTRILEAGNGPLYPLAMNLVPSLSQTKRGGQKAMNTTSVMISCKGSCIACRERETKRHHFGQDSTGIR